MKKAIETSFFFVNSKNILSKTRDNFLNKQSSKYLFNKKITINSKVVNVKEVDDFEGASKNNLNIKFTTVQQLHTDFDKTKQKENCLTLESIKEQNIILIADEAHHLNSSTKKDFEKEDKKIGWESTIGSILNCNEKNLLLEFTATIDWDNPAILEKYKAKTIIRYDLGKFRQDGYSKDVHLLQSDIEQKELMLQAVILSQYRQDIASDNGLEIKPIVLFKSELIQASHDNETIFHKYLQNLNITNVQNLKSSLDKIQGSQEQEVNIIFKAINYFEQGIGFSSLIEKIKTNFSQKYTVNVNEESLDKKSIKAQDKGQVQEQSKLLNSLEDKNNSIRTIFAVNKLNEGWDVLNLFDIVRLYNTRDNKGVKVGKKTIAEAQLIGRGARYCPFKISTEQKLYKRKYDNDIQNLLKILEEFYYHTVRNSKYIQELRDELIKQGIVESDIVEKELRIKDIHATRFKSTLVFSNQQVKTNFKEKNLWDKVTTKYGSEGSNFEYHLLTGGRNDQTLGKDKQILEDKKNQSEIKLEHMSINIKRNALLCNDFYSFDKIKELLPSITSMDNFIETHLNKLSITFYNSLEVGIPLDEQFKAVKSLLAEIKKIINANTYKYQGTKNFESEKFYDVFKTKILRINKNSEKANGDEDLLESKDWYVFNANYGTTLEKDFVKAIRSFIETNKFMNYDNVYLVRNELHLPIYDFEQGRAFYPDFILMLKNKNNKDINYQLFIEPKGDHIKEVDKWKNEFLQEITSIYKNNPIKLKTKEFNIIGIPFYEKGKNNALKDALSNSLSSFY